MRKISLKIPDTIRAKITVLTGGLALLVMFGFGLFLYSSLRWELYQFVDDHLRDRSHQLMQTLIQENGQIRFDRAKISDLNLLDDDTVDLVSPSGAVLDRLGEEYVPVAVSSENHKNGFITFSFWQEQEDEPDHPLELEIFRLLIIPITDNGTVIAYLQVGREIEEIQAALTRLLQLLLVTGPIMVGVAAIGGYWLTGKALAPIEKIRRKAASIQAKDLHERIENTKNDEVGQLADTFNEMLDRLEESFQRQRRFTADASHELRTPLSVIQGEVDVALEHPRMQEEYAETLQSIGAEAQRMRRLVADLLLLARADSNQLRLEYENVDLADLLRLLVNHMDNSAQAAGIQLSIDVPDSLTILGDRDRMVELFINLLDNAIIHAPGSQVTIRAHQAALQAEVAVCDTGPGISEEHLPHIFDRFYRVDPVRERSRHGSGLGLAIAREIVQAHQGQIFINSALGKGTTILVQLPSQVQ